MTSLTQRFNHQAIDGFGRWQSTLILLIVVTSGLFLSLLPLKSAIILVFGSAFILLSIIQPLVPLLIALAAGPFGAYENIVVGNAIFESGQLFFLIALASWLGNRMIYRRSSIKKPPILFPLLLFILVGSVTLLISRSFESGLKEVAKWIEIAIVTMMVFDQGFYLSRRYSTGKPFKSAWSLEIRERWFIIMLLLAGAVQASIGIWQFSLQENGPDHFLILDRFYRAYGTFMQPNPFGGFMGIGAALAIGCLFGVVAYLFHNFRQKVRIRLVDWSWLAFLLVVSALLVLALIMSWSRGAWLGFAAGLAVMILFLPYRRWKGLLLLAAAVGLFLTASQLRLLPEAITSRVSGAAELVQFQDVRGVHIDEGNYAVIERLAHWQAALDMARDNLWLGVGFGNYESAYADYELLNWPFPLGHAHNYYLNIMAETGIIGLLAYLVLWGYIFFQLIKIIGAGTWPRRGIALGILAAWTALSIHHFVDKLYVNNMFIYLGAMLGLQQLLLLKDDNTVR